MYVFIVYTIINYRRGIPPQGHDASYTAIKLKMSPPAV